MTLGGITSSNWQTKRFEKEEERKKETKLVTEGGSYMNVTQGAIAIKSAMKRSKLSHIICKQRTRANSCSLTHNSKMNNEGGNIVLEMQSCRNTTALVSIIFKLRNQPLPMALFFHIHIHHWILKSRK